MSETEVENADSATALDEEAVSSTEGTEGKEPDVILTENTQKRFDQLTGERNQEREAKEVLAAQNAELQSRLQVLESQKLDYQDPGRPKAEDYDDDIEFAKAEARYDATNDVVGMLQKAEQERFNALRQQTLNNKVNAYNQRLNAIKPQLEDFDTVTALGQLQQTDINGQLTPAAEALLDVEHGVEAFYHIQKNPGLAAQLNVASPIQAGILVKSISDQFASVPSINEPPPPVGSEEPGSGLGDPNDDPMGLLNGAKFE